MKNIIPFEKFFEAKESAKTEDKKETPKTNKPKTDKPKKKSVINKKYTHFAVNNNDNKIYNGWEYGKDLDLSSIKTYCKMDLEDSDCKWSDFKICTVKQCKNKNIDPFDSDNWYKISA